MDAKPLPREVEVKISTYRPQLPAQHWQTVADFTRMVVTAARPASLPIAERMMYLVSRLAVWAWQTAGVELTVEAVMKQSMIDRFVTDTFRHKSPSTRSWAANVLSQTTAVVTGKERPVTKVKFVEAQAAPYLPSDDAWLRSWPDLQSTAGRRRNAHGVLGLCRGAGLTRRELELVRVGDVNLDGPAPHVVVRGDHPRTTPINPSWMNHLQLVLETGGDPSEFLLAPESVTSRRSLVADITYRMDKRAPRAHRLRSTWIIEWLERAPAPYVLSISGLTKFKALDRHLPFVSPVTFLDGGDE